MNNSSNLDPTIYAVTLLPLHIPLPACDEEIKYFKNSISYNFDSTILNVLKYFL